MTTNCARADRASPCTGWEAYRAAARALASNVESPSRADAQINKEANDASRSS